MTPVSRVTQLVTVLVTIVTLVTGLQEWREQPRSTTAREGQDTVIACKVHNKVIRSDHDNILPLTRCSAQVGQCFWRKDHRLIYLYPGKYEWAANPASGDCSLRIKESFNIPYLS